MMNSRLLVILLLLILLTACVEEPMPQLVTGEWILERRCDEVEGYVIVQDLSHIGSCAVKVSPDIAMQSVVISRLAQQDEAERNNLWFAIDEVDAQDLPPGGSFSQWSVDSINADTAWRITEGDRSVVVAVLDTGIDNDHEDIGQLQGCFNSAINRTECDDKNSHGTHVAGIVAMRNTNKVGGIGISPNISIMSVKVLKDDGQGTYADIAMGITIAVDNGADVINMSLGGRHTSNTVNRAIDYAWERGVFLVAACGNDGGEVCLDPALNKRVLSVGAIDINNRKPSWSTLRPDVVAPGVAVWSTMPNSRYNRLSGTSMAAPHVAGIAALYKTVNPGASPREIFDKIKWTTRDVRCPEIACGQGLVNAYRTLSQVPRPTPTFTPENTAYPEPTKEATATSTPKMFPSLSPPVDSTVTPEPDVCKINYVDINGQRFVPTSGPFDGSVELGEELVNVIVNLDTFSSFTLTTFFFPIEKRELLMDSHTTVSFVPKEMVHLIHQARYPNVNYNFYIKLSSVSCVCTEMNFYVQRVRQSNRSTES